MNIKVPLLAAAALALSACSVTLLPPNVAPNVPLTNSVEQAKRKLEETRIERAAVEARYASEEAVCYRKFFVNDCLDKAKDTRRAALVDVRAVELEAEYFVRKSDADEHDRELALSAKEFAESEARFAAQPPAPVKPAVEDKPPKLKKPHLPKAAPSAAKVQADAAKRAAKVAAYEKRQAELVERQDKVARKKAERAAKAAKP